MLNNNILNIFNQHETNIIKQIVIILYLKLTYMFEMTKFMFEIVDFRLGNVYTELIWGWLLF